MIVPELGEKIIKMNGALFFFENSISAFIVNCELILKARFEKIYVKHFFSESLDIEKQIFHYFETLTWKFPFYISHCIQIRTNTIHNSDTWKQHWCS